MPYSRISHTRNGASALQYALNGKGHAKGKKRNLLVGTVGFLPDEAMPYLSQCERLWKKASSRNKTQMRRIVVSFSPKELPPDDPNSPLKALEVGMEIARRGYPGHPFIIAVQNDGKGGKIHIHMLSPNINMITYKGFTDEETKHWYLEKQVDEVCKDYFELDSGRNNFEKVSQSERRKREENEAIRKENEGLPEEKQKPLFYIWKDDLKERIRTAMGEASGHGDFLTCLLKHGVKGEFKHTKNQGGFILYELMDTSGFTDKVPANLRSKSYKLGNGFGIEALDEEIQKNKAVFQNGIQKNMVVPDDNNKPKKRKHQGKIKPEQQTMEAQAAQRKLPRRPASSRSREMIDILEADSQFVTAIRHASDMIT